MLEREKQHLEKCLSEWDTKEYPLAKKERDDKLNEVNKAIEILTYSKVCRCHIDSWNLFDENTGLCGTCGGHGY